MIDRSIELDGLRVATELNLLKKNLLSRLNEQMLIVYHLRNCAISDCSDCDIISYLSSKGKLK